jgi:tetratricopeptide (TPR) repeat protein
MQYLRSPVHAHSLERFVRAELLRERGRLQEALAWYETLAETLFDDVVFLAPAQRRMAEIEEELGHRDQAVRHYARFVDLWRDCDAGFRPLVAEAEERLRSQR